jgi:hypothetical protein
LPEGPLEWSSRDEGGDVWFVQNDSGEDKVWQHVGRHGLKAQETLASAKSCLTLALKEVERAAKLVTSGLHPAVGVSSFASDLFSLARRCLVVTPFHLFGIELASFASTNVVFRVAQGCWPVKSLSECLSDQGAWRSVVSAVPSVYLEKQLLALGNGDALHENASL